MFFEKNQREMEEKLNLMQISKNSVENELSNFKIIYNLKKKENNQSEELSFFV